MASSDHGKVSLLYAKSKVYVHPTASAKGNIAGFLALIRPSHNGESNNKDILVSWIPESLLKSEDYNAYVKVDLDTDSSSIKQVLVQTPPSSSLSSYAFSVPLRNVFSVQVRQPSLGLWWGSLVFHTRHEETFPALFFHDSESPSTLKYQKSKNHDFEPFAASGDIAWGGQHFLDTLSNFASLQRSAFEPSILLINPSPADLQAFAPRGYESIDLQQDPFVKAFKDVRWSVLSKLASVTHFTRMAAQSVIDKSPSNVRTLLSKPEVQRIGDDFDSARVYLAKWAMGIAEEAERTRSRVVWNNNAQVMLDSAVGDFEILAIEQNVERRNPVGLDEWNDFFDHTGRLCITQGEVLERIFHGGLVPAARKEAWLFLLQVYPWDSSDLERRTLVSELRNEYYRYKRRWWDDLDKQHDDEFWKDQKSRIEKDVHRTDRNIALFAPSDTPLPDPDSRFADVGTNPHLEQLKDLLITYNEYNRNLGYVQGMSDLLAPLYVVFQDDSVAFCAFCKFMNRMERNFLRNQSGMRDQLLTLVQLVEFMLPDLYAHLEKAESTHLFFFFRMLLVWFKREFSWSDVLRLWEVLWTDYLSSQFHLFVALAILDKHKSPIMDHLTQFDQVLKYMNELSMTMDLDDILTRAELVFYRFKGMVELVDRKHLEQDLQPDISTTLPVVTDNLRQLLSTTIIEQHEGERPPDATGG